MKRSLSFAILFCSFAALAQPSVIPAPVKHLYVPHGFDSNDAVEVVVTGNFPNPCFSRNNVDVVVNDDMIDIKVSALQQGQKLNCPDMQVPFKEVVSIGNLQGGKYQINVNNKLKDTLHVQESSSTAIDEHLYAAIDNVEKKSNGKFVLHGWRYSNCIELDKVEVISNQKDTVSVLPIMKQIRDFCPMKMMPVAYEVNLDFRNLKVEEALIHVRTMDGKSFNSIVKVEERR